MRLIYDGERLVMGRLKMHRRRNAHLARFFPTRRTEAPFIAWFETGKSKLWSRCDQVVPAVKTVLQKLGGYSDTNRVGPLIHRAGIAAAIPEEPGQRIMAAVLELAAQDIAGSGFSIGHAGDIASGLFAAEFSTRQ